MEYTPPAVICAERGHQEVVLAQTQTRKLIYCGRCHTYLRSQTAHSL